MRKLVILVLLLAFCVGCAHNSTAPLPPGAINQFDANTYNSLITAQAAILQGKAQFGSDPEYKTAINSAIAAYNTALAAYQAYHTSGGGNSGAVQAAITAMLSAVANINAVTGQTPKPISLNAIPLTRIEGI